MSQGATTRRELLSQPLTWLQVEKRLSEAVPMSGLALQSFDEVACFGSGSSYYLAEALAFYLEDSLRIRGRAIPSCELVTSPDHYIRPNKKTLAVGISRSGESSELVMASQNFRAASIPVVAVTCNPTSTWAQDADAAVATPDAAEDGMVMLRSFTSMLIAFQYVILREANSAHYDDRVVDLAAGGEWVLSEYWGTLQSFVRSHTFDNYVFLGSDICRPLAHEASLKMQEMALTTTTAYHALEYRHGPKSTAGPGTLVTLLLADRFNDDYEYELARELKALGVAMIVIGKGARRFKDIADIVIGVETKFSTATSLPLLLLPCQILAFETAMKNGANPDSPRNLNPVVRLS